MSQKKIFRCQACGYETEVITCGSFGKCLRFPVTKKESFESLRLPLAKGSSTSNQAFLLRRKDVTALLGARNRYALRLAGHQSPRQVLRDGTAWG